MRRCHVSFAIQVFNSLAFHWARPAVLLADMAIGLVSISPVSSMSLIFPSITPFLHFPLF